MLNLNSIMLGSAQPKVLAEFYAKILGRPSEMPEDMSQGEWFGWQIGSTYVNIGPHSEMEGMAKDPGRIIFNFETADVKEEFERIKDLGATVVAEPYSPGEDNDMWIATFADPDGNYFQLMSPWEENQ